MEKNGKVIRKFIKVYTEVERRCLRPNFVFPGGGKTERMMQVFLTQLTGQFGEVSDGRIVDYCVCLAHFWAGSERPWRVSFSFGKRAIERYATYKNGKRYYEDQWLQAHGLTRGQLQSLIADTATHPLLPYLYVEAEEPTKQRAQHIGAYMVLCEKSTLMWSPLSEACRTCQVAERCMQLTRELYPELYRLRTERYKQTLNEQTETWQGKI